MVVVRVMWPTTHLAIGYLLCSIYTHGRFGRAPGGIAALFVILGTQLPDLIDKPLAWLGVVGYGRAIGHSYLFAIPFVALAGIVIYRFAGERGAAFGFAIGYLAHPFFDGVQYFIQGDLTTDLQEVSFWVWPIGFPAGAIVDRLSANPTIGYAVTHKAALTEQNLPAGPELTPWIRSFEIGITLVAFGLWLYDGKPGWGRFRNALVGEPTD